MAASEKGGRAMSTMSMRRGAAPGTHALAGQENKLSRKVIEDSIFSVLYAMRPMGNSSKRLAILALVVEFVQIISFALDPLAFNWQHPTYVGDVIEILTSIFPIRFLDKLPYGSFGVLFAIVVVLECGVVAAGAWVFARKGKLRYRWPLRLAKALSNLLFSTLYLSCLSVLIRPLDCKYLAGGTAAPLPYMHASYTGLQCWGMPNAVVSIVGIIGIALFFALACMRTLLDCEPNCGTESLLSTATFHAPFRALVWRAVIVLTATVLSSYPGLLGVLLALEGAYVAYFYLRFLPHYSPHANGAVAGIYAAFASTALVGAVQAMAGGVYPVLFSAAFLAACPAAFAACFFYVRSRTRRLCSADYVGMNDDGEYAYYREPAAPYHVEIAARFVREARNKKNDDLDQDLVERAECVYQEGLRKFPKHAAVYLAFSNYLKVFKGNAQLEATFVDRSRHLRLDLQERFAVYRKDREKEQMATGDVGEQSMDLASYVEFQKQLKAAKEGHLKTVKAMKLFWHALLEDDEVAFSKMPDIFRLVDTHETVAERNYVALLQKYPRSVRVLRAFGSFVEQVKNDTLVAEDYYRMADAEEEEISRRNAELGNRDDAVQTGAIDNSRNGVVIMGSNEVITSVNAIACRMWGYKRGEMVGKRITMLMPSPFRDDHHQYVSSYLRTGVAKVVNIPRAVYGLHRDGYIFPIKLYVTRMDLNGVITFVGAITPADTDNGLMLVNAAGKVTACNREAAALFEMGIEELCSRDVKLLVPARFWSVFDAGGPPMAAGGRGMTDRVGASFRSGTFNKTSRGVPGSHNSLTGRRPSNGGSVAPSHVARSAAGGAGTAALTYSSKIVELVDTEVQGLAKDGSVFPLHVKIQRMFDGDKSLLCVNLTEVEDTDALLSIDVRGIIRSCNKHACVMFGYTPVELVNQKIENLMPAPYSTYHHTYLERYLRTGEARVIGSKRAVDGKHKSGSTFGIVLDISRVDVGNETIFVGRITRQNDEDSDALITINQEGMIQNCNAVCSAVWGYRTSEMVGRNIKMLMPPHYAANHDGYLATYMRTRKANVIGTGGRALEGLHQDGSTFPIQLEVMEDTTLATQGVTLFQGRVTKLNDLDALITITKEGLVKTCNRNLCRMFGLRATEELVGKNVNTLMPPEIAARHDAILAGYLETGEARVIGRKRTLEGRHSDGALFPLTLEVSEVKVNGDVYFSARILYSSDAAEKAPAVLFSASDKGPADKGPTKAGAALEGSGPASALKGAVKEKTGLHHRRGTTAAADPAPAVDHLAAIDEGEDEFVLSLVPGAGGVPAFSDGTPTSGSGASSDQTAARISLVVPAVRPSSGSSASSHSGRSEGLRHRHLIDPLDLNRRPDLKARRGSNAGSATDRSAGSAAAAPKLAPGADDRIRSFLNSAREGGGSPRDAAKLVAEEKSKEKGKDGEGASVHGSVHGSQHGSHHDGGSEAGHSQASSATTKKRRRRKRLELLAAAAKRNSGVELLARNIIISVVSLALLAVGAFVAVQQILAEYSASIHSIAASGDRALAAQLAVMEARSLDVAARLAVAPPGGPAWTGLPAAAPLRALDEGAVNGTARRLREQASVLNKRHLALTLGTDGFRAPSAGGLRELMEQPVISMAEFVDTVPPRILTTNMSLWTAGEKFVQSAHLVANAAQFVVGGPASVAGLSASEPARCLYGPRTCRPLQFLLRNGPDALLDGMERAMEAYAGEVVTSQAVVRTVYVVTLAASLALVLALATLVFKPTLRRVRAERDAIMSLFLHIPKAAVKIQAQRKVVVKMESDEETEDEDDDEDGPPPAEEGAAAPAPGKRGISFGADTRGETPEKGRTPTDGKRRGSGNRQGSKGSRDEGAGVAAPAGAVVHVVDEEASGTRPPPPAKRGLLAGLFGRGSAASRYEVAPDSARGAKGGKGKGKGKGHAKGAGPAHAPRGPDRMFRTLTIQYLAALAVTAAFFCAIFAAGFSLVQRFNDDSREIKLASYRAIRAMHVLHLAREFVLDQAAFPAVTPLLRERIVADVARLRREHGQLVRGMGVRSFAPLAELTFRATCLRARPADCGAAGDMTYPATSNGLDSLMSFFFDQIDLLVADADADRAANVPSSSQGPADGAANARFRTLWALGRADVLEGLETAVDLYEESARKVVETVVPLHGAIMGATLAALSLMFVFLFRPMVHRLKDETRRTRRMLMLIPEEVADKVEAINEYMAKGDDEAETK